MATYIGLFKWTDQGMRNIKEVLTRLERSRGRLEQVGGRVIGTWWIQGSYDLVWVVDVPHDEAARVWSLSANLAGHVRTEVVRAYDEKEMERILGQLMP